MKKETIQGPGIKIILDPSQIFPDDPGQGTPAMVETDDRKYTATFDCAADTGELNCGDYMLTPKQSNWLNEKVDYVDRWMERAGRRPSSLIAPRYTAGKPSFKPSTRAGESAPAKAQMNKYMIGSSGDAYWRPCKAKTLSGAMRCATSYYQIAAGAKIKVAEIVPESEARHPELVPVAVKYGYGKWVTQWN